MGLAAACVADILMLVQDLAELLPIQFPTNVPGKAAGDGLSSLAPVTHGGDTDGIPGSSPAP